MIKSALTETRIFDFRTITKVYIILRLKTFTQNMKQTQKDGNFLQQKTPFVFMQTTQLNAVSVLPVQSNNKA